MSRHSPTRRTRRPRPWETREPVDDPLLLEDLDLENDWEPAKRPSRLPSWIPGWLRFSIRWSYRLCVIGIGLTLSVALLYLTLSYQHDLAGVQEMPERSIIYDVKDRELATLHGESRRVITRKEIPNFFVTALRAREDMRFYEHSGVDFRGLARATLRNLKDGAFTQGASTITMQLARNSFELREKSLHRKAIEVTLSLRIEQRFTKDEILTSYINRIYFGSGCHGLEEAARHYFDLTAAELNRNQCALLVGIIRGPHAFSPLRKPEAALEQRDQVLARLVTERLITENERDLILEEPLSLRSEDDGQRGDALQAVRRHIEQLLEEHDIHHGGLRLRSTIDLDIQKLLEREITHLRDQLVEQPQIAVVCIDATTGGIRGIVGGRSLEKTTFNRAMDARRDVGSIITPFIFTAAATQDVPLEQDQAVAVGRQLDHSEMVNLIKRFGFEGPFGSGDDLYRGAVSATPLELATAAATLTHGGKRPRTYFVAELRDEEGLLVPETVPSFTSAFQPEDVGKALSVQFPRGQPRILTGTSPARTDVWGLSVGSEHSICLWIGHDNPRRLDDSDTILKEVHKSMGRLARSLLP